MRSTRGRGRPSPRPGFQDQLPTNGRQLPRSGEPQSLSPDLGKIYMVDNLGIEPSRRCLQGSTAHLCVARGANGPTRTGLARRRDERPDLSCCAGMRTVSGSRTRNIPILGRAPLPLGYHGMSSGCRNRPAGPAYKARSRTPTPYPGTRTADGRRIPPLWKSGRSQWTPQLLDA